MSTGGRARASSVRAIEGDPPFGCTIQRATGLRGVLEPWLFTAVLRPPQIVSDTWPLPEIALASFTPAQAPKP
jgi:hypothetical protein